MPMKLLVRLGDKVIAGLILLMVLYQLVLGLQRWMAEPDLTESVKSAIQKSQKANPNPKIKELDFTLYTELQEKIRWDENLIGDAEREDLRYKMVEINTSVLQEEYLDKLKNHEHLHVEITNGEGKKHCVFPGCADNIAPPPVYIGQPVEVELGEVGVMSIEFTWKEPKEFKDAKIQYCVVQRAAVEEGAKDEDLKWSDVVDEEGVPKKIYGSESSIASEPEAGESDFVLPEDVAVVEEVKVEEEVKSYHFLDFNLDPSTEYAYRVRALGTSVRQDEEMVEGMWSRALRATTKVDQGVGFTRYIPGLRGPDGEFKKGANGEPISLDKVYVRIRKLFDPPWSNQRYFVEFEHRNIIPGKEGQDAIGKVDARYRVKTEDENTVYIDRRKENFLFVGGERTAAAVDAELKSNPKNWKEYRLSQDFTTHWVAVEVIEDVVEEMEKTTRYDAKGEARVVTTEEKKYRYFLVLKDTKTGSLERLELERDKEDLSKRLRTD